MGFGDFKWSKNNGSGIIDKMFSSIEKIKDKFLYEMISEYQDRELDKDVLKYWKNKIFSMVSIFLITCGTPLLWYGAYMFYIHGDKIHAIVEILASIAMLLIITKKSLSINFRKVFAVSNLYFISILLLTNTGVYGAGMVCVVFSLILAGCMLDKKQVYEVVVINLIIFTVLTILLFNGYFDGTHMESYKSVWLINAITCQFCAIILLFLMNSIYKGLEKQTGIIRKSRDLLTAGEAKHKATIANISDVIAIIDENGFVKYMSPNVEIRCGFKIGEFYNKQIWENIHSEDQSNIEIEFQTLLEKDGMEKIMYARCVSKNGEIKHIELTAVNLIKDPHIKGILINFHDITEQKTREERIIYLNQHDSLTGLYNRTFFEEEKILLDREKQLPLSIIIGDINGLKIINDALGHAEGDKLLIVIAKILEDCCGKEHIIARIGGDEFGILLPGTNNEATAEIIRKINFACQEYNKKMSSELYFTSISLGYATKMAVNESLDSLQKNAEENMYKRKLLESRSLHSTIIASMKTTLHEKSQETEEHAQRLIMLSKEVGQKIGLTDEQFDDLELFAGLHDIGKIGINDQILNKPGRLTDEEWVEMKKHSEIGYRIAMSSPELMHIAEYILTHHERFDGNGYPEGLSSEDIPLLSRIVAVVDAYDAMTEDRPYRKGMSKETAITEIIKSSGKQFDPNITEIFIEIISNR